MEIDLKKILWPAAIAAICAGIVVAANRVNLAASSEVTIHLTTEPSSVKLKVGNKALFDGQYVETPIEFTLGKGAHMLRVIRSGYATQLIRLNVVSIPPKPIVLDRVVLGKDESFQGSEVSFTLENFDGKVFAAIDEGFLSERVPFTTNLLEAGATHTLVLTAQLKAQKLRLACEFTAPDTGNPAKTLNIGIRNGGLHVDHCTPIK